MRKNLISILAATLLASPLAFAQTEDATLIKADALIKEGKPADAFALLEPLEAEARGQRDLRLPAGDRGPECRQSQPGDLHLRAHPGDQPRVHRRTRRHGTRLLPDGRSGARQAGIRIDPRADQYPARPAHGRRNLPCRADPARQRQVAGGRRLCRNRFRSRYQRAQADLQQDRQHRQQPEHQPQRFRPQRADNYLSYGVGAS